MEEEIEEGNFEDYSEYEDGGFFWRKALEDPLDFSADIDDLPL